MEVQGSAQEASQSPDQGQSYAELSEGILNSLNAKPDQAPKAVKKEASAEDILRSMEGTKAKAEDAAIEPEEEIEEVQASEESEEVEQNESEEELIDLLYKGEVSPTPISEVKKLAQMGKDYTQKTQELALQKQQFAQETAKVKQEISQLKADYESKMQNFAESKEKFEKMNFAFEIMQKQNPDLFNELDNAVAMILNQYDNPIMRKQMEVYDAKTRALEENLNRIMDRDIVNAYTTEESALKSQWADKMAMLGVIPDWAKVRQEYAEKGYPTVKDALFALYGQDIVAAKESKAKLDLARKQSASKAVSKVPLKTATKNVKSAFNPASESYGGITEKLMRSMGL